MNDLDRLKLLIRSGLATERAFREAGEAAVIAAKTEGETVLRVHADEVHVLSEESRVARFVWSTASVDRMGDVIRVEGWDTTDFARNPIALYQHNHDVPLGRSPAHTKDVGAGKLWGDIAFASEGSDLYIDSRWKLVKEGILRATSVGFMPDDVRVPTKDERRDLGMGEFGVIFERQSLLEISIVTVPANADALGASVRACVDRGVLSDKEADAFMRETVQTEREVFRRLNGLASKRRSAPRPDFPWEALGSRIDEQLAAAVDSLGARLERSIQSLGDRLSAPAGADARGSDASKGYDAGELLQLIDRHTPQRRKK